DPLVDGIALGDLQCFDVHLAHEGRASRGRDGTDDGHEVSHGPLGPRRVAGRPPGLLVQKQQWHVFLSPCVVPCRQSSSWSSEFSHSSKKPSGHCSSMPSLSMRGGTTSVPAPSPRKECTTASRGWRTPGAKAMLA